MLGVGLRAELACRKKRPGGTGRADLAVLVLLMKRDLRLAAGSKLNGALPADRRLTCRVVSNPRASWLRPGLNCSGTSGAMIDDRRCFQLVSWRTALEQHLGRHLSSVMKPTERRRVEFLPQA
jgi:hypothetical protein